MVEHDRWSAPCGLRPIPDQTASLSLRLMHAHFSLDISGAVRYRHAAEDAGRDHGGGQLSIQREDL